MTIAFPVFSWSITDAGPSVGDPDSPARIFSEQMTTGTSYDATLRLKFELLAPTISGATGSVRDGRFMTYPTPTGTQAVSSVAITRYMYLLDATAPGDTPATLQSQLHLLAFYDPCSPTPSEWLLTDKGRYASPVDSTLEWPISLSPSSRDFGSSYSHEYEFVIESVTSFDWTEYVASFSGGASQSYWNPITGTNAGWQNYSGQTLNGTSTVNHTGAYYSLEKRKVKVYFRKDQLTGLFTIDTRLTFSQPDTVGSLPYPDPNEPAQHVDFSASTYKGGVFAGYSRSTANLVDRSGKSVIQGDAVYTALSTGQTWLVRAVTLYHEGRAVSPNATTGGYSSAALSLKVATPDENVRSLATILSDAKRWKYRWPIYETGSHGEPSGGDCVSVSDSNELYSWLLSGTAVTSSHELFGLYPEGLSPKDSETPSFAPTWLYFTGKAFMASGDVDASLKFAAKMPRSWQIKRDPTENHTTVYEKIRWDPTYSDQNP